MGKKSFILNFGSSSEPHTVRDVKASKHRTADVLMRARAKLQGSMLRSTNEKLYSLTSDESAASFDKRNMNLYAYHEGLGHQVNRWPHDPCEACFKILTSIPGSKKIRAVADLGCGEAKIAQMIEARSLPIKVYSYDLVACNKYVTEACNIRKLPLQGNSVQCCIFSLSLMGRDWPLFVKEAIRILDSGTEGHLIICELASRLGEPSRFVNFLKWAGFSKVTELFPVESSGSSPFFRFFHASSNPINAQTGSSTELHWSKYADCLSVVPYKRR